jgi:hypothetical protein
MTESEIFIAEIREYRKEIQRDVEEIKKGNKKTKVLAVLFGTIICLVLIGFAVAVNIYFRVGR